jgi:hypothetical protein
MRSTDDLNGTVLRVRYQSNEEGAVDAQLDVHVELSDRAVNGPSIDR